MDLKPSITIDDLFADVKKSFAKYEKKQKQKQKLRKEASCNTSCAPQEQEVHPNNSKSTDDSPPSKKTMSENILAMLLGDSAAAAAASSPPEDPENLSLSERCRREDVARSIRLKAARLREKKLRGSPKPLEWSNPLFNLPSSKDNDDTDDTANETKTTVSTDCTDSEGSDDSLLSSAKSRKRKASSSTSLLEYTSTNVISTNLYPRLGAAAIYTTSAAALPPADQSSSISTQSAGILGGLVSYSSHRPYTTDWSDEEVAGLVMHKRRRLG